MEDFPGQIPESHETDDDEKKTSEKKRRKSIYELLTEDKNEKSEEVDKEQPPEEVAEDEKPVVYEAYVEGREDQLIEELEQVDVGSPEEAALLVDAAFIQKVHEQLGEAGNNEIDLDEAMDLALDEFELPKSELENEDEEIEEAPHDDSWEEGLEVPLSISERDEDSDFTASTVSATTSPPPTIPPAGPTISWPSSSGPSRPGVPTTMPAGARAPSSTVVETARPIERRPNAAGYFFLGGIVGYLIGRRRGRIRTEEQLIPIQEKLEKQVTDLQSEIIRREARIREIVREQVETRPHIVEKIVEKAQKMERPVHEKHADSYHKPEMQPGRLGRLVLEKSRSRSEDASERTSAALELHELLAVAERLEVEHSNVRKLYEAGRIDYKALKEIVAEYLKSGDFERILKHQLRPERLSSTAQVGGYTMGGLNQTAMQDPSAGHVDHSINATSSPLDEYFKKDYMNVSKTSYLTRASLVSAGVLLVLLLAAVGMLFLLGAI